MHRLGIAGMTVVLVTALAGCLGRQPASVSTSTPAPALSSAAVDLVARTGDYYPRQQLLSSVENTLATACLEAAGFAPPSVVTSAVSSDEEWRPDLAERSRTGYQLLQGPRQNGTGAPSLVDQYVRRLPADRQRQYNLTLLGPTTSNATITLLGQRLTFSTHGCLADARARVYGSPAAATRVFYLPQLYHIDLLDKAQASPAYRRAMTGWRMCMRQAGHAYTDPNDAKNRLLARYRAGPDITATRKLEIAVAVSDAHCATRVDLGAVTENLLRQGAMELPATDQIALNEVADIWVSSVRRATSLVGNS